MFIKLYYRRINPTAYVLLTVFVSSLVLIRHRKHACTTSNSLIFVINPTIFSETPKKSSLSQSTEILVNAYLNPPPLPPTSFSPVTSTNGRLNPQSFLNFSFNSFATLV